MPKKVITIEYESGTTVLCKDCPLEGHVLCYYDPYSKDVSVDCRFNKIISITAKDE